MTDPLLLKAMEARLRAHAPYSRFYVGCAIESVDGDIVIGANVENACYRLGVCAEQSALSAAQIAFGIGKVRRMAVVGGPIEGAADDAGDDAGHGVGDDAGPVTPCGGCRQAIAEAALEGAGDVAIICANHKGGNALETSISALLPESFALPDRSAAN